MAEQNDFVTTVAQGNEVTERNLRRIIAADNGFAQIATKDFPLIMQAKADGKARGMELLANAFPTEYSNVPKRKRATAKARDLTKAASWSVYRRYTSVATKLNAKDSVKCAPAVSAIRTILESLIQHTSGLVAGRRNSGLSAVALEDDGAPVDTNVEALEALLLD